MVKVNINVLRVQERKRRQTRCLFACWSDGSIAGGDGNRNIFALFTFLTLDDRKEFVRITSSRGDEGNKVLANILIAFSLNGTNIDENPLLCGFLSCDLLLDHLEQLWRHRSLGPCDVAGAERTRDGLSSFAARFCW